MHEFGIAQSVLETAQAEARKHNGARLCKVAMRIGELAAVDPDSLTFCFEALVKGTDLDPLELAIEFCPRRYRCPACAYEFSTEGWDLACPQCSAAPAKFISGDELEIAYLELEGP